MKIQHELMKIQHELMKTDPLLQVRTGTGERGGVIADVVCVHAAFVLPVFIICRGHSPEKRREKKGGIVDQMLEMLNFCEIQEKKGVNFRCSI